MMQIKADQGGMVIAGVRVSLEGGVMMQIKADQGGTVPATVSLEGGGHDADKS